MAKVLFIVNEHPAEAFAIAVARETAKLLRNSGHEIAWEKRKFKDTNLGQAYKNQEKNIANRDYGKIIAKNEEMLGALVEKHNPDFSYNFHCTEKGNETFHRLKQPLASNYFEKKGRGHDFHIGHTGRNIGLIEIKAVYRPILNKHSAKLQQSKQPSKTGFDYANFFEHYYKKTTSIQAAREKGLPPEMFAVAIAKKINEQITIGSVSFQTRGRIAWIKKRAAANKKRVQKKIQQPKRLK